MVNDFNKFDDDKDEIAIIGISGRFPGADNVDIFWQNLQTGVESVYFFTDDELISNGIESTIVNDSNYVKAGAVIEDIELFDASFFGFTPREAEITDPQHRLFLECVWQALENAGYNSESYTGQIGLFAGVTISSYLFSNLYPNLDLKKSSDIFQIAIGNDKDHLPTQISYKLNLRGPSINVQTTCSTSLVAVHLACQSLLNGESDIALAGGVSLKVPQKSGYQYQEGSINSPDGHCRAFDAKAQGTIFGNGLGVVVLKRLEDAVVDGDCIHAVIKGSAINNDGSLKVGYTAPSVEGQREVILEALALSGVEPETISYIETHGTGTSLGDPIEIAALTQAFRASTNKKGFCSIGSVKTNIGHLNTAAGVTGLIKTVQALKHKQIPPSLHFEKPNPQIDFANSPFHVNTKLSEWQTNGIPRRAGVSSFGIGGTNAHVILEEAPVVEASSSSRPWQLLLLSAKTSSALKTATDNLVAYLKQHSDLNLADVAHTLQVGRRAFDHRRVMVCRDIEDAVAALTTQDSQRVFTQYEKPSHRPVVFMFSGQGAQYVNMGRELYEEEATFRKYLDICAEILKPHLKLDIRDILYPSQDKTELATQKLQQTAITQPALFVIEYALAQLWLEWGISPVAMIGHSIGEYVAATLAGVFSLEDALTVVATRGRLMQQLPSGSMLAIPLPEKDVQPLLNPHIQLAAVNSPSSCVVSGDSEAIAILQNQLSSQGIESKLLHTSHAFHSLMMQPILQEFVQALSQVQLQPPRIRFISNLTGTWITNEQATNPNYWSQHLRQTVQFSAGISQLLQEFEGVFLEVGPGRTLSTLTTKHLDKNAQQLVLTSLSHPQEQQSDINYILQSLGRLWLFGVEINWSGFYTHEQRHRLPLPTYPFERQRYWIDAKSPSLTVLEQKQDIADYFYIPSWKRSLLPHLTSLSHEETWLLFVDEFGIGSELVNQLEQNANDVIVVKIGQQFSKLTDKIYVINPQNVQDYGALLQELIKEGKIPNNIAYLWSLNNLENYQTREYLEINSLLFLVQSISKHKLTHSLQIWVISNQIQEVNGNESIEPEKATVLGLCKVISQEYPNITCRNVDFVLTNRRGGHFCAEVPSVEESVRRAEGAEEEKKEIIVEQIIAEFAALSSDLIVAYRDRYRWVQIFEPVCLDSIVIEKTPLRKHGVYLFPGGLESLAVVLAEYLAKTLQAKLIFIEDLTFPREEEYLQWLETHSKEDKVSGKIQKVFVLEELDAKVLVVRADTTNYKQMYNAIAPENIGQVHGVVYQPEIIHENIFSSIPEIGKTQLEELLNEQYQKIVVLEQVLESYKLDFCVIFSSLSSILGGFELTTYSVVNVLIDTFIHHHNQTYSLPWYVINWDKLQLNGIPEATTPATELGITQIESIEIFKRIFSLNKGTQVVISKTDLKIRSEQKFQLDSKASNQQDLSSRYSRPNLANSYIAPSNELEKEIAEIWQEVLGISQIGIYDNFYELGGDSLIATQLVSRLRAKFPVELPIRDLLLEGITLAKQSEMIEQLLLEKIEELSEEEVQLLLE